MMQTETIQAVKDYGPTTRDMVCVTSLDSMTIALPLGAVAQVAAMGWTLVAVERNDYTNAALGAWSRWHVVARTPSGDVYGGGDTAEQAVAKLLTTPVWS